MLEIVRGPVPELVSVLVITELLTPMFVLGNVRAVGEVAAVGTATPVPVIGVDCVEPAMLLALSVTVM